jgi:predicted Zn-dependent protease with MMP-like domain/Flp pilus assembly protein TadD
MAPSRPALPSPHARELMAQVEAALEAGRSKVARALAQDLVKVAPEQPGAWALKAAAHAQCEEPELAEEAFDEALERDPEDLEILLAWTDFLVCRPGGDLETLETGLEVAARGRKLARKAKEPQLEAEFATLQGIGLGQLGEPGEALEALDAALELVPSSLEVKLERSCALYELCRFDEAEAAFREVVKQGPEEPWAHQHLGLIAERRGRSSEAARHFAEARKLSPEEFPEPVTVGAAEFEALVDAALREIPADFREKLPNLRVTVEPLPSVDDLLAESPPLSPSLLGLFQGTPLGERSVSNAADHVTARVVLFQKNLERAARTREELEEQVRVTVLHELGHLVGLNEEDLEERGLD